MKHKTTTTSCSEIEQMITEHIGKERTMECSVSRFGKLSDITIIYVDGSSIPELRSWIETHVPMLWHLNIDRCYSERVLRKYNLREDDERSIEYTQNRLFNVSL